VSKIVCAMMVFAHPDRQEQQPTKLNAVLENTLVMSRNAYCQIADVETDLTVIPDVLCHAGEVSQVLLNLVINAAHAIEELKAAERGKISIATRVEDDMVVVSITDTGGGIPEAIRDRIFDPFFTTKDVGRGTGQGLTLSRTAIVDRHGGRLDFETRLGVGTTFFIRLPIHGRRAIAIVDHSGHVADSGSPATMS
jgi:signal transduction histidine kinase